MEIVQASVAAGLACRVGQLRSLIVLFWSFPFEACYSVDHPVLSKLHSSRSMVLEGIGTSQLLTKCIRMIDECRSLRCKYRFKTLNCLSFINSIYSVSVLSNYFFVSKV